jgi:hypothetical protein
MRIKQKAAIRRLSLSRLPQNGGCPIGLPDMLFAQFGLLPQFTGERMYLALLFYRSYHDQQRMSHGKPEVPIFFLKL